MNWTKTKQKTMKTTYRQDHDTGKLYEVVRPKTARSHFIHGDFSGFVSSVDGSYIANAGQLADHNKRHGVSNDLDHLREQSKHRPRQESQAERKEAIRDTMERMESSGFHIKERDIYHG